MTQQEYSQLIQELNTALANGSPTAAKQLGDLLYGGQSGTEQNYPIAFSYWKMAADSGDATAQYLVATCYQNGLGVGTDAQSAYNYFGYAAQNNHAKAQLAYAQYFKLTDEKQFLYWICSAHVYGDAEASSQLQQVCDERGLHDLANQYIDEIFERQQAGAPTPKTAEPTNSAPSTEPISNTVPQTNTVALPKVKEILSSKILLVLFALLCAYGAYLTVFLMSDYSSALFPFIMPQALINIAHIATLATVIAGMFITFKSAKEPTTTDINPLGFKLMKIGIIANFAVVTIILLVRFSAGPHPIPTACSVLIYVLFVFYRAQLLQFIKSLQNPADNNDAKTLPSVPLIVITFIASVSRFVSCFLFDDMGIRVCVIPQYNDGYTDSYYSLVDDFFFLGEIFHTIIVFIIFIVFGIYLIYCRKALKNDK